MVVVIEMAAQIERERVGSCAPVAKRWPTEIGQRMMMMVVGYHYHHHHHHR